ncbi:MAG: undecaprenyldiphospho-muramoylpentapeptide beta-N-acetylglucosaminyltransferase [Bdellovibrionales bacterium]|nr:undecaprenyldiphospho-muramoylpentapeptide beta-N-acetylglucosaminyltransferase [Bdellovibrionales bacterium]
MNKRVFIAGGGTGGHIYPALAIASALKKIDSDIEIHFVGSSTGMEARIIPTEGFALHLLSIGRLNRNVGWVERLKTLVKLPLSLLKSYALLMRYRPQLILGVGGYASAPVVLVGALLGYPSVIWEPNAYPGLANRWLARWVNLALVVFEEAKLILEPKIKRIRLIGLPVRESVENLIEQVNSEKTPDLENKSQPFRVLVFGGSQGARGINNIVSEALVKRGELLKDFEFVHQTGSQDYSIIKEKYEKNQLQVQVEVREYLPEIFKQYHWADLVVCRAGVSTISELAAIGKPAVLIPFPFASDNHQQKNAEAVLNKDAACMILQKDLTLDSFCETLLALKKDPGWRKRLSQNIRQLHYPKAAHETAQLLVREFSGDNR